MTVRPLRAATRGAVLCASLSAVLAASLVAGTALTGPAGAAAADTSSVTVPTSVTGSEPSTERRAGESVSQAYSSYRYAYVPQFNLCLGVYVTARLKATYTRRAGSQSVVSELSKPTINDPAMQVTVKKTCDDNSPLKTRHRANKISYKNLYYGYTCSFDPSFNVGVPWSVGVGVTPDCGDETVAQYGARDTGAREASSFKLTTDGYAFGWNGKDSVVEPGTVKVCTSVAGYFRLQDTDGAERETAIRKVGFPDACLSR